jgi:death-on-curing protein
VSLESGEPIGLVYLDADDVLAIYAEVFACSEGKAADQLRSRSGLEGALGRPMSHAAYGEADLAAQAAVLAHGIAEGQHFVEGNKRTALAALLTFLRVNGYDIEASQEERAGWILRLAEGGSVEELAGVLRLVIRPLLGR